MSDMFQRKPVMGQYDADGNLIALEDMYGQTSEGFPAAVVGAALGSQGYSNFLTLIGDDIMFVGINYSQLPSAAANEGRIARVADRNNMRYVAEDGVWRPDGEGLLYRQLTFGAQQVTAGSTTTPKAVGQAVVPKDCLARNGDVVRLVFAVEKDATTDNGLMNVYAGTTGVIGTDVNVSSSSQTLLSGTTDNAAGYYEYKRINATTLRRALGGAGVTSAVGNSTVNAPADFTVPNMDDNDLTFTLGLYTATAGSGPSVELATLRDFEVVVRPFN